MTRAEVTSIAFAYAQAHARVLAAVEGLSDEQFRRRPAPHAHAIAFGVWHLARWADHLQARLPLMHADIGRLLGQRPQLWEEEGLAARWGFAPSALGYHETGMGMLDDVAATLPLPPKDVVLAYARRAFAAAEHAINALDERHLAGPNEPELRQQSCTNASGRSTVADAILSHLAHGNRHLGEIECLRGLLGLRGTATQ